MGVLERFFRQIRNNGLLSVLSNIDNYKHVLFNDSVWLLFQVFNVTSGVDVPSEDWNYLFILDACRYDMFHEENQLKGELERASSKGSMTAEFLNRNFAGQSHDDIVYVTANPRVDIRLAGTFHRLISVWVDEWSDEKGIVPASRMVDYCIDAIDTYQDKRIIFHFLEPHLSTVGESVGVENTYSLCKILNGIVAKQFPTNSPWLLYQEGEIGRDDIWQMQKERFHDGLSAIEEILPHCDGRTVITSDHGNCYNEELHPYLPLRVYEHPPKQNHPGVREIPWFTVDTEYYTD